LEFGLKNCYNFGIFGHCQVNSSMKMVLQWQTYCLLGVYVFWESCNFLIFKNLLFNH